MASHPSCVPTAPHSWVSLANFVLLPANITWHHQGSAVGAWREAGKLPFFQVTLQIAGGLKLDDHCGPFQPRPCYDTIL
uniref:Uncharacterized protein n=1 Tax=Phasianus colchicus TaxID=9054 RepID=A0A669QH57_PHACC